MLSEQEPLLPDMSLQLLVMRWINAIQRCAQNSDRGTLSGQTTTMCCSIDSLGKTAQHRPTGTSQRGTDLLGHDKAMIRRRTGTDHSDCLPFLQQTQQVRPAAMMQNGWGTIKTIETIRPVGIAGEQGIHRH
jgi:hypothetical protein